MNLFNCPKVCIIPQRFVIAILVMAAISITYLLRVFFITTGKYMIANLNTTSMKPNGTICDPDPTKNLIRVISFDFCTKTKDFVTAP